MREGTEQRVSSGDATVEKDSSDRCEERKTWADRVLCSGCSSHSEHAGQQHHRPGPEQQQDVQMKNSSFSEFGSPQKTPVVSAAPGGHTGIHGPLPQTVLKLEWRVKWMSRVLQQLRMSLV